MEFSKNNLIKLDFITPLIENIFSSNLLFIYSINKYDQSLEPTDTTIYSGIYKHHEKYSRYRA